MITLVFLFAIAAIIASVLAIEGSGTGAEIRRPTGLLTWLASGNWPAKIGGGLLVVGVGALLRYAAINFDIAPSVKLGFGVVAAAVLGFASIMTGRGAAQRAVSLALGGAAFGIAYLTAYSAFALFGYVTSATGLTLLALTSIGAGVFAVTRSALSLALLAMVGAYLAPAFAIGDPGPRVIYGYYAAITLLTLLMVTARGWRPLIHVSFLFTLAGSVFFAWTSRYYTPEHYSAMAPLLLVLVALHVAMPIAERRHVRGPWIERLDVAYLLALPAVATLLAFVIAPSRLELSLELIGLGLIWVMAAVVLRFLARDGVAVHAVIGTVLLGLGVAARFRGLPWELIALAFAVGMLELSTRRETSDRLKSFLAGLVLLLGAVHIITALGPITDSRVFLNAPFIERLIGAALLIWAGRICQRAVLTLDTLLLSVGVGWAIIAISAEVIRWDLVSISLFLHWALIAVALIVFFLPSRAKSADQYAIPLAVGVAATAIFASSSAAPAAAWVSLIAGPIAMIGLAVRPGESVKDGSGRVAAAIVAPIVAVIWAQRAGYSLDIHVGQFPVSAAVLTAVVTLIAGRALPERSVAWYPTITPLFGVTFAIILGVVTLFDIERHIWAVALELLCLGGLALLALTSRNDRDVAEWLGPCCIVGGALLLQANLLRWLGPPGHLTIADVTRMAWPTLVSLLWAAIGAALTLWGRKSVSRALWVGGATLLVAAAIKLILVDFGSLGELTNILAVIAAGGVFLLVGWLAPMPPAAPVPAKPAPAPAAAPSSSPATATAPASAPMSTSAARTASGPLRSETAPTRLSTPGPAAKGVATQEGLVMPESYWKRPAGEADAARAESSSRKIGWTIALIAASFLVLSRCGYPVRELLEIMLSNHAPPPVQQYAEPIPDAIPTQIVEPPRAEVAIANALAEAESAGAPAEQMTANAASEPAAAIPPPLIDQGYTSVARTTQDSKPPLAGEAGIEQLLAERTLRPATADDVGRWRKATGYTGSEGQVLGGAEYLHRTYVVNGPMTFPADLYGAHSVTVIVPRGVPRPTGNPGHSHILDMNQ